MALEPKSEFTIEIDPEEMTLTIDNVEGKVSETVIKQFEAIAPIESRAKHCAKDQKVAAKIKQKI